MSVPTGGGGAPPGWYPTPNGGQAWWDGIQWHAQTIQAPVAPYQPVRGLGRAAQVLVGLAGAIQLALIANSMQRYQMVSDYIDRPLLSVLDDIETADDQAVVILIAVLVTALVAAIVFLVWQHRIQTNLKGALGVQGLEYTPGWAVGWWFVPFANFVKPKQAMNEAWRASSPDEAPGTQGWRVRPVPSVVSWWWGFWVLGILIAIPFGNGNVNEDPDAFKSAMLGASLQGACRLVAAVLCIIVIGRLTERHAQRAERLGQAASGAG